MDSLYDINEYDDDRHRRSGLWISVFIHLLLLLLFIAPLFNQFPKTNEEFKGVLVVFGDRESGKDAQVEIEEEKVEESQVSETEWEEETREEPVEETKKEIVEPIQEKVEEPTAKEAPAVLTKIFENEAEVVAVEEKETIDEKAREKAEAEKAAKELKEKQQKAKEQEAKRLKEKEEKESLEREKAAAVKKAKEEAAEAERIKREKELAEKKKQYGDLFNNSSGDSDNDGNEGDPIGDPDGAALEGISTGKAEIGGGLSDRGVAYEPSIKDNSQKTGKVVIRVCVDRNGEVIEAKFTQKGSNTTDRTLVEIAEKAAAKYSFTSSDIDKQCGTIAIDFKVK